MASKIFSRNFVVLLSDLVEACADDERALDFVIGHEMSLPALIEQATDTVGFWTGVLELGSAHPFACKRVRALQEFVEPGTAPALGRSFWAYPLAPLLAGGGASGAGALSGVFVVVAMNGIFAATAIPNFMRYQTQAKYAEAKRLLARCQQAQEAYHERHGSYGTSFAELGLSLDEAPRHYMLYMGENNRIGAPQQAPNQEMFGYSNPDEGYLCTAVANLDSDPTLDVWFIHEGLAAPEHHVDDLSEELHPSDTGSNGDADTSDTDGASDANDAGRGATRDLPPTQE